MSTTPDNAPLTFNEARLRRAEAVRAAAWLDSVWGNRADMPAFTWSSLALLPSWALRPAEDLRRLAMVAGALFAAPALRVCLEPAPLLRVRELIGPAALEQVLAVPGLPAQALAWPVGDRGERETLSAWGAGMVVHAVDDPLLQASLAHVLSVPDGLLPVVPPVVCLRIVELAHRILQMPVAEANPPTARRCEGVS